MTIEEFELVYPRVVGWIDETLARYKRQARVVADLGFERLALYFSPELLRRAKVIYVGSVPRIPLAAMGLPQFAEFETMPCAGITYLDTFFSQEEVRRDEAHHFHELVHVVQWEVLGPKFFLMLYAEGLERFGYRENPLEVMAYSLEEEFERGLGVFEVEARVREELGRLYGGPPGAG